MRVLFFLGALAVAGLVVSGAIKMQKTDGKIDIEIDKKEVAQDADKFLEEGKEIFQKAETDLHDSASQR